MGAADKGSGVQFEDFLPSMARKLGVEGLIEELCKGFELLMDPGAGKITFRSLKRNAAMLGLGELRDDELSEMMREGDLDGDGALDQMEFCVLMVRLSPDLMDEPRRWLDDAVAQASQFLFH
jgi:Ca2+-binding EF-hand superfamily protein